MDTNHAHMNSLVVLLPTQGKIAQLDSYVLSGERPTGFLASGFLGVRITNLIHFFLLLHSNVPCCNPSHSRDSVHSVGQQYGVSMRSLVPSKSLPQHYVVHFVPLCGLFLVRPESRKTHDSKIIGLRYHRLAESRHSRDSKIIELSPKPPTRESGTKMESR